MRQHPVRLRPDHDLDRVVLALRTRLSNNRMAAPLAAAPPARAAATRAHQTALRTQAQAAVAALGARETAQHA